MVTNGSNKTCVGQCRAHVKRYTILKASFGHGAGSLCSGWVFSFNGDVPFNQNAVCTLPEILLFYTVTLPEILALRDSFVLLIMPLGRFHSRHSSIACGRGCSGYLLPESGWKEWELSWTVGDRDHSGNHESWLSHGGWTVEHRSARAALHLLLLEEDGRHGACYFAFEIFFIIW